MQLQFFFYRTQYRISERLLSSLTQLGLGLLTCIHLSRLSYAFIGQKSRSSLAQIMACCLFSTKPLSEPMLVYFYPNPREQIPVIFQSNQTSLIRENDFENVDCKMSAVLSQPPCVPLRTIFFRGNINIYLHFMPFLQIDRPQVLKILPQVRERTYTFYIVNIMAADVLAT